MPDLLNTDWRLIGKLVVIHARLGGQLAPRALTRLVHYLVSVSWYDLLSLLAIITVVGRIFCPVEDAIYKRGTLGAIKAGYKRIVYYLFSVITQLPIVRGIIGKRVNDELVKIEHQMIERGAEFPENHCLPDQGLPPSEIQQIIAKLNHLKKSNWESGRLSGAVYHGGKSLRELQTEVYGMFTFANQLHPDCFPAVRRMDSEVVSMVLSLYNAPSTACGTTTSGGTESLMLTCLAAREYAKRKRGLTQFEIVAPVTVHAGIDKAAYYFGMKLVHAPLNPHTMQVDLAAVESLIGPNTVMLVGSAPNYPHGIIDDIEGLGRLAQKYELPLHVDACLGSFVVPFLSEVGGQTLDAARIPLFDFRVPGVTSISCDTHKYGFAPKGSSVIMYREPEMRHMQYFVNTDWSGGLYASPTLAGSRPGALMAGCWATLMYMGREGYRQAAESIIATSRRLRQGIEQHPDLYFVYGDPQGSVVAFGSHQLNVYDVSDAMSKRGWHLATLQNPPALHMASTELTHRAVDDLINDLVAVGHELAAQGSDAAAAGNTKALYGVAGSVSTAGVAESLARGFVDFLYKA